MEECNRKKCENCKFIKAAVDFYEKSANRLDSWCKDCRKEERKKRYRAHKSPMQSFESSALATPPVVRTDSPESSSSCREINANHLRLPQYNQDEVDRAVRVFETLLRWRDEDRRKGLIDW